MENFNIIGVCDICKCDAMCAEVILVNSHDEQVVVVICEDCLESSSDY